MLFSQSGKWLSLISMLFSQTGKWLSLISMLFSQSWKWLPAFKRRVMGEKRTAFILNIEGTDFFIYVYFDLKLFKNKLKSSYCQIKSQ